MAENETDLIQTTFLDALVVLQNKKDLKNVELEKKARAEILAQKIAEKSGINRKIVNLYLKSKFPDAFRELGVNALSEKEFPSILKRAKRYFRLRLLAAIGILSFLLGGELTLFTYLLSLQFVFLPILLFILGVFTTIVGSVLIIDLSRALRKGELDALYLPDKNPNNTPSLGGGFGGDS